MSPDRAALIPDRGVPGTAELSEQERLALLQRGLDEHALVTIASADGTIVAANDRFCRVTQYERSELIGKSHRILSSGAHDKEFWTTFWQTIKRGEVWRGEVCSRAKDGTLFWASATVTPLLGRDGKPIRFIAIRTDITQRKRVEAELLVAKEAADRANRAKSAFLAMMSHEIRTPLNSVLGFANLLREGDLTGEQRQFVATICSSGQGLLALLNDILDFSKVEAGQLALEEIRYDLGSLLEEVHEVMAFGAKEKGLAFSVSRPSSLPRWLVGDPGRLRQVLLNLVGNAIKFTESGSVVLRAECRHERDICLTVEDTGIGIPSEALSRLFLSFSQADPSTTRRFGGTGLGLAISKRLVELMGGNVEVMSTVGVGTSFTVSLPRRLAANEAAAQSESTHEPEQGAPPATRRRVLVVEDHAVNQLLARHMLQGLSCVVDVAGDGREGVDMWKRLPYDLIFMDCHMPIMDGIEATREIRRLEAEGERAGVAPRDRVKIFALTASAMTEEKAACLAAGMDEVVLKPVTKAALRRCLGRLS